jgi:hypothetical protein
VAKTIRQRAPARAASSRNTGRLHLVTPGDIISERLGDFTGIRKHNNPDGSAAQDPKHTVEISVTHKLPVEVGNVRPGLH